jgi:hypothetical protein
MDKYVPPALVEIGATSFIVESLEKVHKCRTAYLNNRNNIFALIVFIGFVSAILMYKYKGKPTREELEERQIQKREYISNHIQFAQKERQQKERDSSITGLPLW